MTRDAIRRALGLGLVMLCLLTFEPGADGLVSRVLLPFVAALGAYLVIGSLLAVALAVAALAAIHSDLGALDTIHSRLYPAVAILAGGLALAIVARRFTGRVRATRVQRESARAERAGTT